MARTKLTLRKSNRGILPRRLEKDPVAAAIWLRKRDTRMRKRTLKDLARERINMAIELAQAVAYGAIRADRAGYGEDVLMEEIESGEDITIQLKRDEYIDRCVNRVRRRLNMECARSEYPVPLVDTYDSDEEDSEYSGYDGDSSDEEDQDQNPDQSDGEENDYLIDSDPASSEEEEQEEESDWENAFDEPLEIEATMDEAAEEAVAEEDEDEEMNIQNVVFYEVIEEEEEEEEEDPEEVIYLSDDSQESMFIYTEDGTPPPSPDSSSNVADSREL